MPTSPNPEDRLAIEVAATEPLTLVLDGELDPHTSPMLQARIDELLAVDSTAATLDVGGVGFIDSAGLRVLADTHRRLAGNGGALTVHQPTAALAKLLSITGLDEHLEIT